ncbi:MAG: hypothetical protein LBU74_02835 [Methanobacteriaceae archaeon]|jgi:hypothetical protein|nr:hypothetical protein [Candidatus Methanorudis spinitermitis]
MKVEAKIQIEYKDSKDADISFQSLKIENKGYIESDRKDNLLNFKIYSDSLSTFLATVDDLIFSERLVEKILETASSI